MTTYLMDGYNQSDDPNKNWKKLALYIFIIIAGCVIASFFGGCNSEKQLKKSVQRVITDSASFDYVGRIFTDLHKCADKITVHSDTLITHDTTETFYHYTDSILHTDTVVKKQVIHDKYLIHDTLKVIDGQQISLLQSQLTQRDLTIAGTNGQLLAAHQAVLAAEKKTRTVEIILGAIVLNFVGTIAFKIYKAVTGGAVVGAATSTSSSIISTITNAFKKK